MKDLRIAFIDFWPQFEETENIFLPILQKYYNIIIDVHNPHLIFHSIYSGFKETHTFNCKKILFLGENYRALNYNSDYTISFDPHTDKNYHLPLWQFYCILNPETKQKLLFEPRSQYDSFDRFCSFTVSNGGNFLRNATFQNLNTYKKVHSYGRYMTNDFELQKLSQGKHWRAPKTELFNTYKHKFSITFENTSYPGYITEKLMDGFLSGSLPVYWGDPQINRDWNKEAFVNAMSKENFVEYIKYLDTHEKEFREIYSKPIFTDEQKERHLNNIENFESWLIKAIEN